MLRAGYACPQLLFTGLPYGGTPDAGQASFSFPLGLNAA
jgi:hypothetical protein